MRQLASSFKLAGFVFALLALLTISSGLVYGQAIDGSVVGTILDSQGAVVGGAEVSATNVATNVVAATKTNSAGEYRFEHLPIGTYRISAKMTGFKTTSEQVEVQLNTTGTRNLTLSPGSTTETIEVSGTPPTIDTTTSQLQNTFDSKVLGDLPTVSVGSGVINLSLLDAGVTTSGGIGLGSGPSISGQRPRNNNFTVEGVDNNNRRASPVRCSSFPTIPWISSRSYKINFRLNSGTLPVASSTRRSRAARTPFTAASMEYFQNRKLNGPGTRRWRCHR